jgi:DeoR/GlpR family transcriptional regulator of sugar metabolism
MIISDNPGTRFIRLGQILKIFMEKEIVSTTWLSQQFQTTTLTIQRDLLLLEESDGKRNRILAKDAGKQK